MHREYFQLNLFAISRKENPPSHSTITRHRSNSLWGLKSPATHPPRCEGVRYTTGKSQSREIVHIEKYANQAVGKEVVRYCEGLQELYTRVLMRVVWSIRAICSQARRVSKDSELCRAVGRFEAGQFITNVVVYSSFHHFTIMKIIPKSCLKTCS
ncbi:hypothetical protein TNCV_2604071 [Trichonephila clavipes]|nr:hypothetical protein TNCV_2604071 [Trichonephila clavipes]